MAMTRLLRLLGLVLMLGAMGSTVYFAQAVQEARASNRLMLETDPDGIPFESPPKALFVKAYHLLEQGRLDESITLLTYLEGQGPKELRALAAFNSANAHMALADFLYDDPRANVAPIIQQARRSYVRALHHDSELYPAKFNLEFIGFLYDAETRESEGADRLQDSGYPETSFGTARWRVVDQLSEGLP